MNNADYHEAGIKVLNWRKLDVSMKARYGKWKASSDATWTTRYLVTVTHSKGKRLKKQIAYPFELKSSVDQCVQWWKENGCLAVVEEVT